MQSCASYACIISNNVRVGWARNARASTAKPIICIDIRPTLVARQLDERKSIKRTWSRGTAISLFFLFNELQSHNTTKWSIEMCVRAVGIESWSEINIPDAIRRCRLQRSVTKWVGDFFAGCQFELAFSARQIKQIITQFRVEIGAPFSMLGMLSSIDVIWWLTYRQSVWFTPESHLIEWPGGIKVSTLDCRLRRRERAFNYRFQHSIIFTSRSRCLHKKLPLKASASCASWLSMRWLFLLKVARYFHNFSLDQSESCSLLVRKRIFYW